MELLTQGWGLLLLVALFSELSPSVVAHPPTSRTSKVSKRSRVAGSLPGPPTRPVYHSPPINAFSLKDLEPRDKESEYFERKPKTGAASSNSRAVSLPRAQQQNSRGRQYSSGERQYNSGEQRYFSSQAFLGVQPGGAELSASDLAEFGFSPDNLDLSGFKQSHEFGGRFNSGEAFGGFSGQGYAAFNNGQGSQSEEFYQPQGGFKYNPPTTRAPPKILLPTYSKHQQSFFRQHNNNNDVNNHDDDAHYEFDYQVVNQGDPHAAHYGDPKGEPQFFGHSEKREGAVTRGRYHVLLPDGRHQKVNYLANKEGYHANVSYN